jgi:hypothetical protein
MVLGLLHFVTPCYTKFFSILLLTAFASHSADWPTLHGDSEHTGRSEEQLQFPLTLQWAVEFQNERVATAAEPVIWDRRVFVPTHIDIAHALDAVTGDPIATIRPASNGKFLSYLTDVNAQREGFLSAFIDGRKVDIWKSSSPIRQIAVVSDEQIYVTSEDLRLHCFDLQRRRHLWISEQMFGQTARDYYPVIVYSAGKKFVVVRTNPVLNMAKQIADDRNFLTKQDGIDAGDWKKLDAWIKSPAAAGTPELIAREQDAIAHYLETNQWAQTFYVFDAETGKRAFTPPILWVGGCQGVGTPPAITKEGKAVVLYRSAYGNWNHGVAPLVAIGLLNFETGRIEPLRHNQGAQPPWNTFWGTADEAQNFTIAGDDLIIVHQGTLARFNLKTHDLEKIWGERDTYGGFKNPSWARNEWHGPARGGVAISNGRIYWLTGSRLLCLGPEKPAEKPSIKTIPGGRVSPRALINSEQRLTKEHLADTVAESLSKNWAPLYVEPGLAGREFFFGDSRELFTSYAYAFPHLKKSEQLKLKTKLTALFQSRPPFGTNAIETLTEGDRREYFQVPPQALTRLGNDKSSHRFGGVYSAYLYAQRCDTPILIGSWAQIQSSFNDFENKNPNFGEKPELYFNRYLASLIAYEKIAAHVANSFKHASAYGDSRGSSALRQITNETLSAVTKSHALIERAKPTLIAWWRDAATTLTNFNGSQQLDPFIQKGDKLSWAVSPHRHKLAIFQDLTPEIAAIISAQAPEAAAQVWATFTNLAPTWHLMGEERQYHFGENFVDTPDFALSAFQAYAFTQKPNRNDLLNRVDIPFCRADLYHIQKLAIALETQK